MSNESSEKLPSSLLEGDETEDDLFGETYFESEKGRYWCKNSRRAFRPVSKDDIKEEFKNALMLSDMEAPSRIISMELARIRQENDVEYVGSLPGKMPGLFDNVDEKRCLITSGPRPIEPKKGRWDTLLKTMIGALGAHQTKVLLTWLRQGIQTLQSGHWQPAQALILVGPAESVKSLIILAIVELLGGRSTDAYKYMSGGTEFAGEFLGVEVLKLDDAAYRNDHGSRSRLGAMIKQFTSGSYEVTIPIKHREPMRIRPFYRIVGAINDEDDCITMLPPTDGSHRDKYILLYCRPSRMPMPANTGEEKALLRAQFEQEYPALVHYLMHKYDPPSELTGGRMDVQPYHHPKIVSLIKSNSPETTLLDLIDNCWVDVGGFLPKWSGTSAQLIDRLESADSHHREVLRSLNKASNSIGILLGKLARNQPKRVKIISHPSGSNRYELSGSPIKKVSEN